MCLEVSRMIFASQQGYCIVANRLSSWGAFRSAPQCWNLSQWFPGCYAEGEMFRQSASSNFMVLGRWRYRPSEQWTTAVLVRSGHWAQWRIMATASRSTGVQLAPNSVRYLQLNPVERRTLDLKLQLHGGDEIWHRCKCDDWTLILFA